MKCWILTLSSALFLFSACSHAVNPQLVKTRAVSDLNCSESAITVSQVTRNNWRASGCSQQASYTCSDANFLSDGVCLKEGN
jgi:hypothetical protein